MDEDFGKVAARTFSKCGMPVCMGGLVTDLDMRALDAGEQPTTGVVMKKDAIRSIIGRFGAYK